MQPSGIFTLTKLRSKAQDTVHTAAPQLVYAPDTLGEARGLHTAAMRPSVPSCLLALSAASTRFGCLRAATVEESTELVQNAVGSAHEVLRCSPAGMPAKQTVLVVTGNPGLAGFYSGFARMLATDLTAEVVVLGLAGHVAWTSVTRASGFPRLVDGSATPAFPLEKSTAAELRTVFDALDTDGSGAISSTELREAMQRLGMGRVSQRRLKRILREFDLDGSGEIELDEFAAVVASARAKTRRGRGGVAGVAGGVAGVAAAQYRSLHALDEQVDHLTAAMARYVKQEQEAGRPLTIVAHSIGAWLVSRVLGRLGPSLPRSQLPLVLYLMPFLEQNMDDPSYKLKFKLLTRAPWLIPLLVFAAPPLRLAPTRLRRWLLASQIDGMDDEYVALVEEGMLHRGAIHNYLHLARTEMYSHQATFDTRPLRRLVEASRLRALYVSAGDEWAPIAMERRLAQAGGADDCRQRRGGLAHVLVQCAAGPGRRRLGA